MNDLAHYLRGYVAGYWQGYEFGVDPTKDVGEEEDEGGSASGDADAAAGSTAPDPGQAEACSPGRFAGRVNPGSRASDPLPLPAIGQPALPPEVEVAGDLEMIYVHRGMITALAMLVETFRASEMYAAASICERAVRGIEIEDERR